MSQNIKFKIRTKDRSEIIDFDLPIIPLDDPMFDQFKAIDLLADLQEVYQKFSKETLIEKTVQDTLAKEKKLLLENTPEQIKVFLNGAIPSTIKRDVAFYKAIVTNVLEEAFPHLDWAYPQIPFSEIGKIYFHEYLPNFDIFLASSLSKSNPVLQNPKKQTKKNGKLA